MDVTPVLVEACIQGQEAVLTPDPAGGCLWDRGEDYRLVLAVGFQWGLEGDFRWGLVGAYQWAQEAVYRWVRVGG